MPAPVAPKARGNRRRTLVLILAAVIAIAAFAFWRWRSTGFDWTAFASTFTGVDWVWFSISIPFILMTYWIRALRWRVMLLPIQSAASRWRIFVATAIGFTAIVFFGRAGELVRPYLIAKKERVSFSSQMAAWLLERILDLMLVLLIFGAALLQVSRSGVSVGPRFQLILQLGGTVIGLAGAACVAVLLVFRYAGEKAQQRLLDALSFLPDRLRSRIAGFLRAFMEGMHSTRDNSHVLALLAYSVLEWTVIIASFYSLLRAFPVTQAMTLTDVMIFMGFVSFGAAVQIPGVGGGVQVASVFVLTEFFRLPLESAAGMALVLWAVTFVAIVPFGVGFAFSEGLKWDKLSHISEETAA